MNVGIPAEASRFSQVKLLTAVLPCFLTAVSASEAAVATTSGSLVHEYLKTVLTRTDNLRNQCVEINEKGAKKHYYIGFGNQGDSTFTYINAKCIKGSPRPKSVTVSERREKAFSFSMDFENKKDAETYFNRFSVLAKANVKRFDENASKDEYTAPMGEAQIGSVSVKLSKNKLVNNYCVDVYDDTTYENTRKYFNRHREFPRIHPYYRLGASVDEILPQFRQDEFEKDGFEYVTFKPLLFEFVNKSGVKKQILSFRTGLYFEDKKTISAISIVPTNIKSMDRLKKALSQQFRFVGTTTEHMFSFNKQTQQVKGVDVEKAVFEPIDVPGSMFPLYGVTAEMDNGFVLMKISKSVIVNSLSKK